MECEGLTATGMKLRERTGKKSGCKGERLAQEERLLSWRMCARLEEVIFLTAVMNQLPTGLQLSFSFSSKPPNRTEALRVAEIQRSWSCWRSKMSRKPAQPSLRVGWRCTKNLRSTELSPH